MGIGSVGSNGHCYNSQQEVQTESKIFLKVAVVALAALASLAAFATLPAEIACVVAIGCVVVVAATFGCRIDFVIPLFFGRSSSVYSSSTYTGPTYYTHTLDESYYCPPQARRGTAGLSAGKAGFPGGGASRPSPSGGFSAGTSSPWNNQEESRGPGIGKGKFR